MVADASTPSSSIAAAGPRPIVAHRPRSGRTAPALPHYVMFPYAGVERLVELAVELGKPISWIYDSKISLMVEGTAEVCFAFPCRPGGQIDWSRSVSALGACQPFRVTVPLVDLQSVFAAGERQAIVLRLLADVFSVGYIDVAGAVHFIEDEPADLIQRSDDLLLRVFQQVRPAGELGYDVEDYLRERHLLVG